MILKKSETNSTNKKHFDLLGTDEVALSMAFAFMLASDRDCYFKFLRYIDIPIYNTKSNFKQSSIEVEKHIEEGRTDIELFQTNKYHVIIECKIGKAKVKKQREQYLPSFDKYVQTKTLCVLTQERDSSKQVAKDIIIKSWYKRLGRCLF